GSSASSAAPSTSDATAASDAATSESGVPAAAPNGTAQARQMGERLIYSVDRVPEDTFETPRAVTVIGREDILRRNGLTLSDVLAEETGFIVLPMRNGEGSPIMRGLLARHVLIMVDGVKLNDALWRTNTVTKEQLNLIDLSQVERIEIVRGVVSVLGTEALGGVINVITRKGPDGSGSFGGTVGVRYASADQSLASPVDFWGRTGALSYHLGGTLYKAEDLRAGGEIGRQNHTGYQETAFHGNAQYAVSPESSLTVSYQSLQQKDLQFWQLLLPGATPKYNQYDITPVRMRAATVAYQDLTSRSWSDALNVKAYWNVQDDGTERVTAAKPNSSELATNTDRMLGLNIESGKFFGAHHVLYGLDLEQERIGSDTATTDKTTGAVVNTRGRYTQGAKYQSTSVFLNDRFDVTRFATFTAGIRYGSFQTKGQEELPYFGHLDLNSTKKGTTGAVNVVVHATPQLNVIAGAYRGFRSPNLDDMTKYFLLGNRTTVEIPNPSMSPENITSMEGGLKYESSLFSGSAFYFQNDLTNLIVRAPSSFNGLPFIDTNGNGKKDTGEPAILQNKNLGRGTVHGIEADFRIKPTSWLLLFGNYTQTAGHDKNTGLTLPYIQPKFATTGVRFTPDNQYGLWSELAMRYASSSVSTDGNATVIDAAHLETSPGFRTYAIRGGMNIGAHIGVTAAVENLTNEKYSLFRYPTLSSYTAIYQAGRQLVLGTTFRF
ncbi:MAG: TonB-dependent receptor, partial [Acidobacteriota bacterium]